MKNLIYIIIIIIFCGLQDFGFGQNCLPNGIVFTTQSQIDNFPNNFPGCTIINGNVIISGGSVTNLNGLSQVEKIMGNLDFQSVSGMPTISGLNNLTLVNGMLRFASNNQLSVSGFNALEKVGGNLLFDVNLINSIPGLSNLDTIGGDFYCWVTNVDALSQLKFVGGILTIKNASFSTNFVFNSLNKTGSSVLIESCNGTLNGFNSLRKCSQLSIDGNITQINGFNQLDTIQKLGSSVAYLKINSFTTVSISGFTNLTHILNEPLSNDYAFIIGDLPFLNSINAFSNLAKIEGFMSLGISSSSLVWPSFNNLQYLRGVRYIGTKGQIPIFNQFSNLSHLEFNNTSLTSINGYNNLLACNTLNIINNTLLTSINGLSSLSEATKIDISNNSSIPSIGGLNSLNRTTSLFIRSNAILSSITGLSSLDSVLTEFELLNNPVLNNISGLNHTISIGLKWYLLTNPNLISCNVIGVCQAANNGKLVASGNSNGCNTIQQILNTCNTTDTDGDGVIDIVDNCDNIPNPGQEDSNNDGEGDVCDSNSDSDMDSVVDSLDNCVTISNTNQADANNDGQGDKCDTNSDTDGDGFVDALDNCPSIANPNQQDCNSNGIGDVCENFIDTDCDGIQNSSDNCVSKYNPLQYDLNNNGIGDACEDFPKVGINTNAPKTELHLSNGSLYIDNPEKAIILKGPNNLCYKTVVNLINNQPTIGLVLITCPN